MTTYAEALEGLRSAQKPNYGVPAYSRFVNRPLGRQFAAVACVLGLTPSQVTVISALVSATGIVLIATVDNTWVLGIGAAVALVLGYALDAADGQLARLTKAGSAAGEWLDHSVDAVKISGLHLAVLVGLYRFADLADTAWYLAPIAFELVAVSRFSSMLLIDQLRRSAPPGDQQLPTESSLLRSWVALVIDYGALCLLFVTWGSVGLFLVLYTVMCVGNWAYFVAASAKQYRELLGRTRVPAVAGP